MVEATTYSKGEDLISKTCGHRGDVAEWCWKVIECPK